MFKFRLVQKFSLLVLVLLVTGRAVNASAVVHLDDDWLLGATSYPSTILKSEDKKDLVLSNGLVQRTFRLGLNVACYDFRNLTTGQ